MHPLLPEHARTSKVPLWLGFLAIAAVAFFIPPSAPSSPPAKCGSTWKLGRGEDLAYVARRCGLSLDAIRRANPRVDPQALVAGMVLELPRPSSTHGGDDGAGLYEIRAGDTLSSIAREVGTTPRALAAANPGIDPDRLSIGAEVRLPRRGGDGVERRAARGALARIEIQPRSGPPGSSVHVLASGLAPGQRVGIGAGPLRSEYDVLAHATADAEGRIAATVDVPHGAGTGRDWVFVIASAGRVAAQSERFHVRPRRPGEVDRAEAGHGGSPPALTLRGRLTGEGVECQALRASDGTLYTLVGDLEGHDDGEHVIVEARGVDVSFCMQGETLHVLDIRPDDTSGAHARNGERSGRDKRARAAERALAQQRARAAAERARVEERTLARESRQAREAAEQARAEERERAALAARDAKEQAKADARARVLEAREARIAEARAKVDERKRGRESVQARRTAPARAARADDDERARVAERQASKAAEVSGTLTGEGILCPTLRDKNGALYTLTGDLAGHAVGDRVTVRGRPVADSTCLEGQTLEILALEAAPVEPQPGADQPSHVVRVEGRLTDEGVTCPALRARNGRLYSLAGDVDEFKTGDRVVVEGVPIRSSLCTTGETLQVRRMAHR